MGHIKVRPIVIVIIIVSVLEFFLIYLLVRNIFFRPEKITISPIPQNYISRPETALKYYFEYMPEVVIEDKQNWLDYTPKYTINNDGLNERFNYQIGKIDQVFRIVTLGDSHTFGYLVNTEDNYPEQLEDLLNQSCVGDTRYEVINLGIPGFDIQYSVERYKIKGQKYSPDLVLWFLKQDDLMEINELTRPKAAYYRKNPDPEELKEFQNKGLAYYEIFKAIEEVKKELGTEKILETQLQFLNSVNYYYQGPLVLFAYDDLYTINPEFQKKVLDPFISQRATTYFDNHIPTVYKINDLHLKDKHPNTKGYQLIALNMLNYLVKNQLIPCN